jgi:hypothetical protein
MNFEQWAEEMKKGLSLQSDEKPKVSSWSYDRFEGEIEEEPTYDPSQNS